MATALKRGLAFCAAASATAKRQRARTKETLRSNCAIRDELDGSIGIRYSLRGIRPKLRALYTDIVRNHYNVGIDPGSGAHLEERAPRNWKAAAAPADERGTIAAITARVRPMFDSGSGAGVGIERADGDQRGGTSCIGRTGGADRRRGGDRRGPRRHFVALVRGRGGGRRR